MPTQEIELKLRIRDTQCLIQRLQQLGAAYHGSVTQTDSLFESVHTDFKKHDQALRLRREVSEGEGRTILTFKGTPTHTSEGHKIRDEFETFVTDVESMARILGALGFMKVAELHKIREQYVFDGVRIEIDTLVFGTFLELEGEPEAIERVRSKLNLENETPISEGYNTLQEIWNKQ